MTDTAYKALRTFILKGVSSKAKAREALEDLSSLISDLEEQRDLLDDALCTWEEGDDAEERADGKERVEQVVNDLDSPLTQAGLACGMAEYVG
jgi:exonuclease VII small subunit